ncbi:hypothetical protein AB0M02_42310 [Actinoplanes sp. NPDC051861]|uniref:hypothetical protein n=1 Tax=Actinoplanes sp. NPDC051861 TaxID=3155170 RepID=UPI00343B5C35
MVEFIDVTLTPYVDSQKCRGTGKCRARLAWSVRSGANNRLEVIPAPALNRHLRRKG